MNADVTVSLSLVFSIIAAIGVILNIVSSMKKSHETEEQKQLDIEKNFVKINMKLDTFCEQTREILRNQEKSNDELKKLSDEIIKHEIRIKRLEEKRNDKV